MFRQAPRLRRIPARLLWVLLALSLAISPLAGSGPARAANTASAQPVQGATPLGQMLRADGTLDLPASFSGNIDTSGWALAPGPGESPRFVSARGTPSARQGKPQPGATPGPAKADDGNWDDRFAVSGPGGAVSALAVVEGTLYALSDRKEVLTWDGNSWAVLGGGLAGYANAMVADGGQLFVGGWFNKAGVTAVENIAGWDGSSWYDLGVWYGDYGQLINVGEVTALAFGAEGLYVAGDFHYEGYISRYTTVASWDGYWHKVGFSTSADPVQGDVYAMATSNTDLYVGGSFWYLNGYCDNIIRWDGHQWSCIGSGMDGAVNSIVVSGSDVYAAGSFSTVGGVSANNIARWDGSAWSALGSGVNGVIKALALDTSELYAGGEFTAAGGVSANNVARWDGSAWSALGSGVNGSVAALAVSEGVLYAGGPFTEAGGQSANYIATWSDDWNAIATSGYGVNGTINALAVDAAGGVYAAGRFTRAGAVSANNIAHWDGSAWSDLGAGVVCAPYAAQCVAALAVSGGDLYVGGSFTAAGGISANNIARWDGSAWSALGSGVNGSVAALAASEGVLYVGGDFVTAGGLSIENIARWDGSAWSDLAGGVNGAVHALAASGGAVYVGGQFTYAGSLRIDNIARWQGGDWYPLGPGVGDGLDTAWVNAIAVSGHDVYVAGYFWQAGSVSAINVARWDGGNWSALGDGLGITPRFEQYAPAVSLAVVDGTVYGGGWFGNSGNSVVAGIAAWDGGSWSSPAGGIDGPALALAAYDDDLFVGGQFGRAGANPSYHFALWHQQPGLPTATPTRTPMTSPTPTPTGTTEKPIVGNGDFESGSFFPWTRSTLTWIWDGRSGNGAELPGWTDPWEPAYMNQLVTLPSDVGALTFWYSTYAEDPEEGSWNYHIGSLWHDLPYVDGWTKVTLDLAELAGQTVGLGFQSVSYYPTGEYHVELYLDDIEISRGLPEWPCQPVSWIDAANVSIAANSLTKTGGGGGWNAGAASNKAIPGGQSGYAQATVLNTTTDYVLFGLSSDDSNQSHSDIDFGLETYWPLNELRVMEGGVLKAKIHGYAAGDVLSVAVRGGAVSYYRNGTRIYTSTQAPASALLLDSSLYNEGAVLSNARLCASSLTSVAAWTPTPTRTGTTTPTITRTPTLTRTPIITPTASATRSSTTTPTTTGTATGTRTPTHTSTSTAVRTATLTPTGDATGTATATPTAFPFTDAQPSDYFYWPVQYLTASGAISGYNSSPPCPQGQTPCFRPFASATRAQALKITLLAAGVPLINPPNASFSDVPVGSPFFSVVETAAAQHVASGYADGTFRPNNPITRGQLSKIVALSFGWTLQQPAVATFRDVVVGSAFFSYVETAVQRGILGGYDCGAGCREFRPGNEATRGQIAKIVYNALLSPNAPVAGFVQKWLLYRRIV